MGTQFVKASLSHKVGAWSHSHFSHFLYPGDFAIQAGQNSVARGTRYPYCGYWQAQTSKICGTGKRKQRADWWRCTLISKAVVALVQDFGYLCTKPWAAVVLPYDRKQDNYLFSNCSPAVPHGKRHFRLAHASDKNNCNRDHEALTFYGDQDCNNIMGIQPQNINNMQSRENPSCIASSAVFHFTTMDAIFITMLWLCICYKYFVTDPDFSY